MSEKQDKPCFTKREMELMAFAMQSLKSGAPDIDYEKMAQLAGMNNPRSASNAWASIKKKLAEGAGFPTTDQKKTPKKPAAAGNKGATPKKAADPASDSELTDPDTVTKKTPRKRATKANQDNDGSPKKRGRKTKAETIKEEDTSTSLPPMSPASEASTVKQLPATEKTAEQTETVKEEAAEDDLAF